MQANQASRQWPDDNKGKEGVSEQKGMKYTDMEITLPVTKAEGWENKLGVWEQQRQSITYIKQIDSKVLLYSTENDSQYLVITCHKKEYEKKRTR